MRNLHLVLVLFASLLVVSCNTQPRDTQTAAPQVRPPGLSLTIRNGSPVQALDLGAGDEFVFDRIVLEAENRELSDSRRALQWLQEESSFRMLNWSGVKEARGAWRNYKDTRPAADVFATVFEGASWMSQPNSVELSVIDARGQVLANPLVLTNDDFMNGLKQWDFDMVKAEYRYENFRLHKDLTSANVKRAVARIVLANQTNLAKVLRIPAAARALKLVWDKNPGEPYIFPIRFLPAPFPYGLQVKSRIEPQKDVYQPGDTIHVSYTLTGDRGEPLKVTDFQANGLVQLQIHLDGPRQNPTYHHEEWLNDFVGKRFLHMESNTVMTGPPSDQSGTHLEVDLHVPPDLPKENYGTFNLTASASRNYASENTRFYLVQPIQIGQKEETRLETFACTSCHASGTPMDIGGLIPPMWGHAPMHIDNLDECVACHDNSQGGSRRLHTKLHLIHMNRAAYTIPKNNCAVCHVEAQSIRKVSMEVCSNCHDGLHENNRQKYSDSQCQGCHMDYERGHVVAK